ncbi:MAG TPA: virulence protein RhuM/Fic/DOC family protein [Dinghuibacter sp.]|uniref:virulence protein RhuM/Fic/DOC family protein n=1 Tax=Dinghuibacter sp. TaxID=2024697 RepID=UPI002BF48020|nr:virulence protein RhuM/Fic/DOC family protein [Dinghuibacter sp.]HTJ11308.1 virulence protein RhuM/Fic/DOC family protein [Dinghuibacter sp.]
MSDGKGEIVIYQMPDGQAQLEVKMEGESLWLSQKMMAELFDKDIATVNIHINNIYNEGELGEESTTEVFSVVQQEGNRKVNRKTKFYNLDVILSVGYRVSSKRGTAFRIWANKVLKDHLVKGYSLNEKKLKEKTEQFEELKETVKFLGQLVENNPLISDEARGLFNVVTDYAYALDILDKYDHQVLEIEGTSTRGLFTITYPSAMEAIRGLKDKFGGSALFGNEKDESFRGSLAAIYQTFDGHELYPSVEEKAANLLYFVIKNHSFSDGNKRIAAFLFVWFLEKNHLLYRPNGTKKIGDNALVALTLMIAESKPEEKEMMTRVVVSLINTRN